MISDMKDKADALKEAMSQYEETRSLIQDIDNEIVDKLNAWQDNNYEILTYELELKIEVND
jgi:5-bromo-4-chloroindolyl phosphate hydrolysis protein